MKRYLLIFVVAFVCITPSPAQITSDSVIYDLSIFHNIPQEKMYVHLDRPYYSAGDTIWYKVYMVDANTHVRDTTVLSKVIYLDFLKKETGQIYHHTLIKNSTNTSGAIILSDSIKAGVFEIVAYTNWMKNFPDNFFHKEILIYDRIFRMSKGGKTELNDLAAVADLQFFPEGGNLVAGLFNRVAFKAVNKQGKGVDVKIVVVSEKGDTVAAGLSQHLGMGKFFLPPKPNTNYYAIVKNPKSEIKYPLPKVEEKGFTMLLDNFGNKEAIKITIWNNFPSGERPFIVVHQQGKLLYVAQGASVASISSFLIPRKDIPNDGIVHFTVFDSQGTPVCERLVYNKLNQSAKVLFAPDKDFYGPRQKTQIEIMVSDYLGNPIQGDYSLSITDGSQVIDLSYPETIETYLQLSSDLKSVRKMLINDLRGSIEQPGYYFTSTDSKALNNLDLLLMTQGWRRFDWKDVLNIKKKHFKYELETAILVSGKATLANNKKLQQPLDITMNVKVDGGNDFFITKTNLSGDFAFSDIDIIDSAEVFIQAKRESGGRNINIDLNAKADNSYLPETFLINPLAAQRDNSFEKSLEEYWKGVDKNMRKVTLLDAVEVKAKREVKDDRRLLYGNNYLTVNVENENCGTSIGQILRAKVAGLTVSGSYPNESIIIRGKTPDFLLDGNLVSYDLISSMPPCNLEAIDVLKTSVAGVGTGSHPVISILTKLANPNRDWSKEKVPGVLVTKIQGYESKMKFYNPVYDLEANEVENPTDFRSTLYWNPSITTDKNGKAEIIFWNSDSKGSFNIHLEGLSFEGKAISKTWSYLVK